jgi:tRNA (cmo5U34)-methyltransferase
MSTETIIKDATSTKDATTTDRVFATGAARASDFEFNAEVAEVFEDMLVRSVPFYREQQLMIQQIARKFYIPGTQVYDLGCSTGVTLVNIAKSLGPDVQMVGYDYSQPMLDKAKRKISQLGLSHQIELRCADFNKDLAAVKLENASVVTVCWTLQFVRPLWRDSLIEWIYRGMAKGGALICMEKILTNSSDMNRYFIEFYYEHKSHNGYSKEEILKKREALENVLVPYRTDENFELFRRNGFTTVETCFQWFNFAGYLCVKGA